MIDLALKQPLIKEFDRILINLPAYDLESK